MKRFFVVLCLLCCSGCVSRSVSGAYDGVSGEYPGTAQSLAAQAADELSRRYPPGRTSVSLNAAPGAFGATFEEQLRQRGFAVRPGGQFADVGVSYTLDTIRDEPSCYLRVTTSDGQSFGFAKELAPEPDVPVTVPPIAARAESAVESRPLPDAPAAVASPEPKSPPATRPAAKSAPVKAVAVVPPPKAAPSRPAQEAATPARPANAPEPSVPLSYVYKPLDAPYKPFAEPAISPDDRWEITPGSLRGQIHGWTARSGYTLVWNTDRDYEMSSYSAYRGDFVEAVKRFFSGLQRAGYPLRITIYKGNQTLEITEN